MPAFAADLHNHTPASADHWQQDTSAREIVETALEAGLHVYGATDHFTCEFVPALIAAADEVAAETGRRLFVIPGTELRIIHDFDEAHIMALFDPADYELRFTALLNILGLTSPCAEPEELPCFAFEHDPVDVCRIIHALGGIACVAHADRDFGDYRLIDTELFARLAAEPAVVAIDLLDPDANGAAISEYGASIIHCSDSHSCEEIGVRRSFVAMDELSFSSLKGALEIGRVVPELLA